MKARTLNFNLVVKKFENLCFLELWSARKYRCQISRCQKDVANCQITGWRPFFMKISEFVYLVKIYLCVNLSSDLHAPKWNDGAQVARWLILQVSEWRHLAFYDAMTSDFWKNHRDHFSYQYFACVNITSWLEHQKWSYCCFYFCIDYEICRNHVHPPRKHPPQFSKF